MKQSVWWLVVCAVLYVSASGARDIEYVHHSGHDTMRYGIELLLTKLDIITSKLQRMEEKLLKTENKSQKIETTQEKSQKEKFVAIQKLDKDIDHVHNITRQIMNALSQLHPTTKTPQQQERVNQRKKVSKRPQHRSLSNLPLLVQRCSIER
uniref:Putative secreted protein n=1 Tax=Anopheles triannulatus TaxID=58253 RepID=A0A2M4B3V7_9DIPT